MKDAVADLPRQVQAGPAALQPLHDSQALLVMRESLRQQLCQRVLAPMAERRVAQVVTERDGFRQVFVEVERAGDGAGNLGHFQRVRQSSDVVVAYGRDEDVGLVLQPSKRLGVDDPVAVALELQPHRRRLLRPLTPPTLA